MIEQEDLVTRGAIERSEDSARAAITNALDRLGFSFDGPVDLRPLPFEGRWGVASSAVMRIAGQQAQIELDEAGDLEGLSKKQARKATNVRAQTIAQEISTKVADQLRKQAKFASVEAANGYINISFDPNVVASALASEVATKGDRYGSGSPRPEKVMVEHSQPNTHKVFHIGHFRNTSLGVAISRILEAAGYPVVQTTYPGDIGMHVIKTLWLYDRFYRGEEPEETRGRWLGQLYAEADKRLNYRKEILAFLSRLPGEHPDFLPSIDRMLKKIWRSGADDEDIAYLLGRFTNNLEIDPIDLNDELSLLEFWEQVGQHLAKMAEEYQPELQAEENTDDKPTPGQLLAEWQELNANISWWPDVPAWEEEIRETFARWERQDPDFVELWERTREWSLEDFRRIFAELGGEFDTWFFESEVDNEGKAIVKELLDQGIAEVSDGLTVVKIDEKLGLDDEVYRTMPVLRSDGTSLYSTKDLALTKRKYEEFGIDRSIWVVDVRQSLYFQQIFKILELWGFEQAKDAYHLPYEIVTLPEGVISSRSGRVPVYDDIREAVLTRSREIIEDKNPELPADLKEKVAWQVGIGSLKYAMLIRDNNKVVVFDLDEALSFDGHAAPYIQYAHARASTILEKADWFGSESEQGIADGTCQLDFEEITPEELDLLQHIAQFPADIQRAADEYRPLIIATYVYELAKRFNDFYHACPVLRSAEPVRTARLALVDATRTTLSNGLRLLGIEAPDEM